MDVITLATPYVNDFADERDDFIRELNVRPSDTMTESILIYWAYLKWKRLRGGEPMDHRRFFIGFPRRFDRRKSKSKYKTFYLVDDTPFKVSDEERVLVKQYLEELRAWEKESIRLARIYKAKRKKQRAANEAIAPLKRAEASKARQKMRDKQKEARRAEMRLIKRRMEMQNLLSKLGKEIAKNIQGLRKLYSQK